MEVVWTGVDSPAGSVSSAIVDWRADAGADPVCVCVGGFWRYGTKARTLCSATAGDMLAHHWLNAGLYPRVNHVLLGSSRSDLGLCDASMGCCAPAPADAGLADMVEKAYRRAMLRRLDMWREKGLAVSGTDRGSSAERLGG